METLCTFYSIFLLKKKKKLLIKKKKTEGWKQKHRIVKLVTFFKRM